MFLFILTAMGCSEKSSESSRSQSDNDFIEALTYHHEFKVSAIIDDLAKTNNIDKKIQTERVAQTTNFGLHCVTLPLLEIRKLLNCSFQKELM